MKDPNPTDNYLKFKWRNVEFTAFGTVAIVAAVLLVIALPLTVVTGLF